MEVFVAIFFIWVFIALIRWLASAATSTTSAPPPALSLRGTGKDVRSDEGEFQFHVIELEAFGCFPVTEVRSCAFIVSVFDVTDGWAPVNAVIHEFQESETFRFQQTTAIGKVSAGQGFGRWVRIGSVITDILQAPRQGRRKLRMIVRLVDTASPPRISSGFNSDMKKGAATEPNVLWLGSFETEHSFSEPGYLDCEESSLRCASATVRLAMIMAMADGTLHDHEGVLVRQWVQKRLDSTEPTVRGAAKQQLNDSLREGYRLGKTGSDTAWQAAAECLNTDGSSADRMECVDMLFAMAASDGSVNPSEMSFAKRIAAALEIDEDELAKLVDRSFVSLSVDVDDDAGVNQILGIDATWDRAQIRRHLREQFQRWNNRLTTLESDGERESAQRMLDMIADARKRYS